MLIGGPIWGALGDRFSKKILLSVVLLGSALTFGMFGLQLPAAGTVAVGFVRSAMVSGFAPLSMALVSSSSSALKRGSNLSYVSSARALGWVVGGAASGFVLEVLGFRGMFTLLAGLPLLAVCLVPLLGKAHRIPPRKRTLPFRYLTDRWLAALYSGVVLRQMGIAGSFSLLFVYMARIGIEPRAMGIVSAVSSAAQVLGLIVFGRLSDRLGRRKIFLLGFALSVAPALLFAFAPNLWGIAVGHLLVGTAFSALYIGSTAHIGDVIPSERHGVMLGLFDSARAVGGVVGPLVAGVAVSLLGFGGMLVLMSGISLLGFFLVLGGTHRPMQDLSTGLAEAGSNLDSPDSERSPRQGSNLPSCIRVT